MGTEMMGLVMLDDMKRSDALEKRDRIIEGIKGAFERTFHETNGKPNTTFEVIGTFDGQEISVSDADIGGINGKDIQAISGAIADKIIAEIGQRTASRVACACEKN